MLREIFIHDGRLTCFDAGKGPVLLLVHGFPLDHRMWSSQLAALAGECRVIAPDLRGFGRTAPALAIHDELTMEHQADDLAELITALAPNEPVTFCGLSMGGYIAWQFWKKHRAKLARLILCDTKAAADSAEAAKGRHDTAGRVLKEGTGFLVESMMPKLLAEETRKNRPEIVAAMKEMMSAASPDGVAAALKGMAARPDMSNWLPQIDVPTLVICGAEDVITPAKEMRPMAEKIPGAKYVEIAAAGHMSPLEKPDEVNAAIRAFMK